jgi:hypothetical protein
LKISKIFSFVQRVQVKGEKMFQRNSMKQS